MSKTALIDQIVRDSDVTKESAGRMVDTVFQALASVTARKEPVRLQGFGTFELKRRAGKIGRNPGTGEPVNIPARDRLTFRPAKGT